MHAADALDLPRDRRIFVQRQMDADLVVVALIGVKQMTQMPFAEDNNMVKTIPPDRSDDPLRISVLPWRASRDRAVADAHGTHTTDERWAVGTIAVTNEITWYLSPCASLGELPSNPFRIRMGGHTQPQQLSTA